MKKNNADSLKKFLIPILLVLVLGIMVAIKYFDFGSKSYIEPLQYTEIALESKSCLECHKMSKGFSASHSPHLIGCVGCHLGQGLEATKEKAHEGMVLIPGNLSNATETCGKCHSEELKNIEGSLMTTNSGIVAVDKFIFGEADSLDYHYHIKDIGNTASEKHLRDLCANCHLGAEKKEFGEITELSRGGGCIACHLNYSDDANKELNAYISSNKTALPKIHPSTDIFMNDTHCFGCHSRSSRISTNYEGWHETMFDKEEVVGDKDYKVFDDLRVYKRMSEDVHHQKGMLCIDCHTSQEVMGDGQLYAHEEDAVKLQCSDCHFIKGSPESIAYDKLDRESKVVFRHRGFVHKDKEILVTKKDKNPLVNTYVEGDKAFLVGKKNGELHEIKPQSIVCSRDNAHKDMSCSSCHSAWAPRCIGCHTSFDKDDIEGFDLLDKKEVIGQWNEYVSDFLVSYPTLGIREKESGNSRKVEPAIPGMIMTLDNGSYEKGGESEDISFHRLYAPNAPHTTAREVRDCKSCHTNPIALGYGSGELKYSITNGIGNWQFIPDYAQNKHDGLPEDAWIGFMNDKNQSGTNSTRHDFRPFTIKEQQRILLVGACLQCHNENSGVMVKSTAKFNLQLKNLSEQCILPKY
ncbi:cytochrome c family protein [Maribacter sp. HTCC2170]|uniref:cytochrome c family protein n=1 Tax=Maribacter sp. (strain HTCC2170 / KCCM 42371) TaxID=313603 RepID=UPI00006AFDBC|nr:cytochrome c family protein [Maribacter sp. HTCC2170]EAR01355.1 cytochrome c family protein [Maribacter sp. HTCC2170]